MRVVTVDEDEGADESATVGQQSCLHYRRPRRSDWLIIASRLARPLPETIQQMTAAAMAAADTGQGGSG